jgi:hypothetical protein
VIEKKNQALRFAVLPLCAAALLAAGCATRPLKHKNAAEILKNDEFEKAFTVEKIPAVPDATDAPVAVPALANVEAVATVPAAVPSGAATSAVQAPEAVITTAQKTDLKNTSVRNAGKPLVGRKIVQKRAAEPGQLTAIASPREPSIEDSEGFEGRRPKVDPYRIGEKVTLEVSYFNVVAGDLTLEVSPFVQVNGRKSYSFIGRVKSTSVFAMFYAVDDWFETYVDYETLVPYSYALHVKESKQLRETRSVFDWSQKKAKHWDKKINAQKKIEEKRFEWEIPHFSQNIFTAVYYLRNFKLTPGKKLTFHVAHENENLVVTGEVLRREKLTTPAGVFNTVVIKPKIELNGSFKPVGDIFLWLTDDDRKFPVKIESQIKIGKIVGVAKSIEQGRAE